MQLNQTWDKHLKTLHAQLESQRLVRKRGGVWRGMANRKDRLDFGSNDYLGLRGSSKVIAAIQQAAAHGWGSGASPVLSGYTDAHQQLEQSLADLSGTEFALVFSSGYACNVGSLSALADEDCIVFSDQLNHASLIDGLRLSRATRVIYPHNNMPALEQILFQRRKERTRALIVTESVFSMDGDEAPLRKLVDLAERFDCGLVVDEAHAVGLFGSRGSGLLEELELTQCVLLKLGTLSKAIGGIGGYATGSRLLIEHLVNRSRSFIFSTAMPSVAAAASVRAIEILQQMQAEREELKSLSIEVRQRLQERGWQVLPGRSPILPIVVGDAGTTLALSNRLCEQGIYVPAIRPPTVPENTCRLRISLTVNHSMNDIERLIVALENAKSV